MNYLLSKSCAQISVFSALILIFIFFSSPSAANNQTTSSTDSFVVIITIDGFSADDLWNESISIPTIRKLAGEGNWSSGMQTINPSLTWPNHLAIVSGLPALGHQLIFNGKIEFEGSIPFNFSAHPEKDRLTPATTLFEAAHNAGLRTAAINWPATVGMESIHDNFPDSPDPVGHMSEDLLWDLFDEDILDDMTSFGFWRNNREQRDEIWVRAAEFLIDNRMPHLLALHLLNVDHTQHRTGRSSEDSRAAMELADRHIEMIYDALSRNGIIDDTTIFLLSDHGMKDTPNAFLPNQMLFENNLLHYDRDGNIESGVAQAHSVGGFGMVYFDHRATKEEKELVYNMLRDHPSVERVVQQENFADYKLPSSELSHVGELAFFSKPGTAINIAGGFSSEVHSNFIVQSRDHDFPLAHHGFLNDCNCMNALFIAYGREIDSGSTSGLTDITHVAPSVSYLLDLPFINNNESVMFLILDKLSHDN
ncbi:MAG: alkaline phosphatase family protein [Balneolales bacterium]|nr:alkaline phosphatase family protein [Balneolales bacterium]